MPKCRYCQESLTKFDKEICPFCGGKKPLEGVEEHTCDITQCIDIMNKNDQDIKFRPKKIKTNALLCMFLGFFGADAFYLGFKGIGIARIFINILIYGGISALLFFFTKLNYFSFVIPFGVLFLLYFVIGIINLFLKGKKDANGVFIR